MRNNPVSPSKNDGAIAQLVEHRTENPCVPGSNPGGTTTLKGNMSQHRHVTFLCYTKGKQTGNADGHPSAFPVCLRAGEPVCYPFLNNSLSTNWRINCQKAPFSIWLISPTLQAKRQTAVPTGVPSSPIGPLCCCVRINL